VIDLLAFRRFEKLRRYELLYLQQQLAFKTKSLVQEEGSEDGPDYLKISEIVLDAAPLLKTYSKSQTSLSMLAIYKHVGGYFCAIELWRLIHFRSRCAACF
jgi:hypothetical protein